jgi:hypothetical protein
MYKSGSTLLYICFLVMSPTGCGGSQAALIKASWVAEGRRLRQRSSVYSLCVWRLFTPPKGLLMLCKSCKAWEIASAQCLCCIGASS